MTPPPFAHTAHWLVNVLYVLPIVVVLAALGFQALRDRRRGGDPGATAEQPPPP